MKSDMAKAEEIIKELDEKGFMEFASDNGLEAGEILLPEEEFSDVVCDEFAIVPAGKYEMLIRDSEKLASIGRYLSTEKPTLNGLKVMMEVV